MNENVIIASGAAIEPIVTIGNEKIVLESIFVNEDGNVVLRMYESSGVANTTDMYINFEYSDVYESDMLTEKRLSDIEGDLSFSPFEVKTVVIVLKK